MDTIELLVFKMIIESFNSCVGKEIALPTARNGRKVEVIKGGIPFKNNKVLELFCDSMSADQHGRGQEAYYENWDANELHRIIEAWHNDTLTDEERIRIREVVDKVSRRTNQLIFN